MQENISPITSEEKQAIRRKCSVSLLSHPRKSIAETLSELIIGIPDDIRADFYGSGNLIEEFESKIARILGFPAALFLPSGTMAQTIALRIWADRKKRKTIAFHPLSHLELHENLAYSTLHGLSAELIGAPQRLITLEDLQRCGAPLAALLLELPQREIGGQLPSWMELTEITAWARNKDIALHLDGARLWECQPFYQKSVAEIAQLFDSVYVSFYKGIGAIAGAALAGDAALIAEAKVWQRRHGGNLIALYPYILSARHHFDSRMAKMPAYVAKARELYDILTQFPHLEIRPAPPQTNMMHLLVKSPREKLNAASLEIARTRDIYLFHDFRPTSDPAVQMIELTVGDSTLQLERATIEAHLNAFFGLAFPKSI